MSEQSQEFGTAYTLAAASRCSALLCTQDQAVSMWAWEGVRCLEVAGMLGEEPVAHE